MRDDHISFAVLIVLWVFLTRDMLAAVLCWGEKDRRLMVFNLILAIPKALLIYPISHRWWV